MPDEHHMIRAYGLPEKLKMSFAWSPVPFLVVTRHARTDKVFPRVGATACARNDVVDRQRFHGIAAVLTTVIVAAQDILP